MYIYVYLFYIRKGEDEKYEDMGQGCVFGSSNGLDRWKLN